MLVKSLDNLKGIATKSVDLKENNLKAPSFVGSNSETGENQGLQNLGDLNKATILKSGTNPKEEMLTKLEDPKYLAAMAKNELSEEEAEKVEKYLSNPENLLKATKNPNIMYLAMDSVEKKLEQEKGAQTDGDQEGIAQALKLVRLQKSISKKQIEAQVASPKKLGFKASPNNKYIRRSESIDIIRNYTAAGATTGGILGFIGAGLIDAGIQHFLTNKMVKAIAEEYGYEKEFSNTAGLLAVLACGQVGGAAARAIGGSIPGYGALVNAGVSTSLNLAVGAGTMVVFEACKQQGISPNNLSQLRNINELLGFAAEIAPAIGFIATPTDKLVDAFGARLDEVGKIVVAYSRGSNSWI